MKPLIAKKLGLSALISFIILLFVSLYVGYWQYNFKMALLTQDEFSYERSKVAKIDEELSNVLSSLNDQGKLLHHLLEQNLNYLPSKPSNSSTLTEFDLTNGIFSRTNNQRNSLVMNNQKLVQSVLTNIASAEFIENAYLLWHGQTDNFVMLNAKQSDDQPSDALTWLALYSHQSKNLINQSFFSPPFRVAKTRENKNYGVYGFVIGQRQYYILAQIAPQILKTDLVNEQNTKALLWHTNTGFLVSSNVEAQNNRYVLTTNPLLAMSTLPLNIQKHVIYQSTSAQPKVEVSDVDGEEYFALKIQLADKKYSVLFFESSKAAQVTAVKYAFGIALFSFTMGSIVLFILFAYLYRALANPASTLIDYIEQQSSVFEVSLPEVPKGWMAWFEKIQQSFQDNRNLLSSLTEKNKELDTKVKLRTRELMQQTISKDRNLALNRAMMNTIPDSLYYKNVSGGYLGCNKSYEKLLGLTEDQLVAKTAADLFTPEQAAKMESVERKIISTHRVHIEQELVVDDQGEKRLIRWLHSPITNKAGEVLGILGLGQDVTEQQANIKKLSNAAEEAQRANQVKGQFIANISHEIRTPMNSIIGMLQLLQSSAVDSTQGSYIRIAETSAQSLLAVINNILDFSKGSAEKLEVESQVFSLSHMLNASFANSASKAMQKGVVLDTQFSADFPEFVEGDEVKLSQIFTNLIGNAVKFTEHGSVILSGSVLATSETTQTLCFQLTDTGIGIADEQQKKVFEAFSQADNSVTREYGGTGLGLTITYQLVELLNGSIELKSKVGEGTTFMLVFDFNRVDSQPKAIKPDVSWYYWDHDSHYNELLKSKLVHYELDAKALNVDTGVTSDDAVLVCRPESLKYFSKKVIAQIANREIKLQPVVYTFNSDPSLLGQLPHLPILTAPINVKKVIYHLVQEQWATPASEIQQSDNLAAASVLVVEDNRVNQQVLSLMLQAEGAHVTIANDGVEALSMLDQGLYDLIVTDIQMPNMDGVTLTKRIRKTPSTNGQTPIVIVSAHTAEQDITTSIAAGADAHLAKPIQKAELVETLSALLLKNKEQLNKVLFEHINVEFILRQFNYSVPTVKQVLLSFLDSHKADFLQLCDQAPLMELTQLQGKVHNYKGVLGNIGAEPAHKACLAFESQLKEKQNLDERDLLQWQNQVHELFDVLSRLQ